MQAGKAVLLDPFQVLFIFFSVKMGFNVEAIKLELEFL